MKVAKHLVILVSYVISSYSFAQTDQIEESNVQIGVFVDLAKLQTELNSQIPEVIESIDQKGKTCVKAQWLKTKGIPKCTFKGIKLYCKDSWIKTKTTPDISCDITGTVRRTGEIKLEGHDSTLLIKLPLHASVTARGRGEIGKNIKQSVDAAAEISFKISNLGISSDWRVKGDASGRYNWTKKPSLKLFNLIDVSVANSVSPEVNRQLDTFSKKFEESLTSVDLKPTLERYWNDIQEVKNSGGLYSRFVPSEIDYTGFQFNRGKLETVLQLSGTVESQTAPFPSFSKLNLKQLNKKQIQGNHSQLHTTLKLELEELSSQINSALKSKGWLRAEINQHALGKYKFEDVELASKGNRLVISSDLVFDDGEGFFSSLSLWSLFTKRSRIQISGLPEIEFQTNTIRLRDFKFEQLDIDSSSNKNDKEGGIFSTNDIFEEILSSSAFASQIEESLKFNFSNDLERVTRSLGESLPNKKGFISIKDVVIGKIEISNSNINIPISVIIPERIKFEIKTST